MDENWFISRKNRNSTSWEQVNASAMTKEEALQQARILKKSNPGTAYRIRNLNTWEIISI